MILTYKRESVCECGFRVLKDSVPLGTKYEVHPTIRTPLKMKCGGCGKVNDITGVFALGNEYGKEGFLPIEIFEDKEEL